MQTDSMFYKGSTHPVCQDYATHGSNFVVISDGCSSSPDTDVGARLLALKTRGWIENRYSMLYPDTFSIIANEAYRALQAIDLGIGRACLDATLGVITVEEGIVDAFLHGDGAIICKTREGETQLYTIDYSNNCPFYPSYYLSDIFMSRYKEMTGNVKTIRSLIYDKDWNLVLDESFEEASDTLYWTARETSTLQWIVITTDGLFSFLRPNQGNLKQKYLAKIEDYLKELTNFKSINGEWVKRRTKAFLNNKHKEGWEHYDDFTMGGISFSN